MEQAQNLYSDPDDARAKLTELDLTPPQLWGALKYGWSHAVDCTLHDPSYVRAFLPTARPRGGCVTNSCGNGWKANERHGLSPHHTPRGETSHCGCRR